MRNRAILLALMVVLLLVTFGVPASAQETNSTLTGTTLTVQETRTVTASVEVEINGETYVLRVPATLIVDTQADLTAVSAAAKSTTKVGSLNWTIVAREEHTDSYIHSRYEETESSSPDNKLIVFKSEITNLDNRPFDFWGLGDQFAFDEVGNTYEYADRFCDEVNPGATGTCTYVFDVAKDVVLVGLDLEVTDHRRLTFEE